MNEVLPAYVVAELYQHSSSVCRANHQLKKIYLLFRRPTLIYKKKARFALHLERRNKNRTLFP